MLISAGCALFLLAQARIVLPRDLPGVVLPASAVRAQLVADQRAATSAPKDSTASTLLTLLAEHGKAEQRVIEDSDTYRKRRALLIETAATIAKVHGQAGLAAMRALSTEKLEAALSMRLPEAEVTGVMGAFATLLEHNGAVVDGIELAPHFVLRTLYKARWNLVCGLTPIDGFSHIERLAYFGWMGLQSNRLEARDQLTALERYAAEGGSNARIALAILRLSGGDYEAAAAALSELQQKTPTLRLRNFLVTAELGGEVAATP